MEVDILQQTIDTGPRDRGTPVKGLCHRRTHKGGDQILSHLLSMAYAGIIAPRNGHTD